MPGDECKDSVGTSNPVSVTDGKNLTLLPPVLLLVAAYLTTNICVFLREFVENKFEILTLEASAQLLSSSNAKLVPITPHHTNFISVFPYVRARTMSLLAIMQALLHAPPLCTRPHEAVCE